MSFPDCLISRLFWVSSKFEMVIQLTFVCFLVQYSNSFLAYWKPFNQKTDFQCQPKYLFIASIALEQTKVREGKKMQKSKAPRIIFSPEFLALKCIIFSSLSFAILYSIPFLLFSFFFLIVDYFTSFTRISDFY